MQQRQDDINCKLNNVDFSAVKRRLCLSPEEGGFDWEIEDVESAIQLYVSFLKSVAGYCCQRSQGSGPLYYPEIESLYHSTISEETRGVVAVIWEMHILNTRQYVEDCQRLFKCLLHYSPELSLCDVF